MDKDWQPPAFHAQCQECFEFTEGPFKGQNPGHMTRHVAGEPSAPEFYEFNTDEHPLNISHRVCDKPECQEAFQNRYRGWIEQRKAEKAREAAERAAAEQGQPEATEGEGDA